MGNQAGRGWGAGIYGPCRRARWGRFSACATAGLLLGCSGSGGVESETATATATVTATATATATATDATTATEGSRTDTGTSLSGTGTDSDGTTTTGTASDSVGSSSSESESGPLPDMGDPCEETCEDGVCVDGVCCSQDQVCGDICCAGEAVCSFLQCVVPGDTCIDASECPEDSYCEYTLGEPGSMGGDMCEGGYVPATGKCLPSPPECPPGEEPEEGEEITCLPACEYIPENSFTPELKYQWDKASVMMPPIVIQLDDDNCDDVVDERDIPEIVFMSFAGGGYNTNGTLHAISIVGGEVVEKFSINPQSDRLWAGRALAAGNIDGEPGNEIVACTDTNKVRAFTAEGTELWISDAVLCDHPSIADFDGDGQVEVLVQGAILDGKTGATKVPLPVKGPSWWSEKTIAADVDADGLRDIATPPRIFHSAGGHLLATELGGSFPAIADFDLDGTPEIVAIHNVHGQGPHHLHVWRYDPDLPEKFEVIRANVDINGPLSPALCAVGSAGNIGGGGPPTIADFNGDGVPDVGVAGGIGYAVFDGAKLVDPNVVNLDTFLWIKQTQDCSSAFTGSSVFDFNGDGQFEVASAAEIYTRIYNGSTGEVLAEVCNTSGTLHEYPLVADVDNDGQADIVVASNDYSGLNCGGVKTRGIRIFGDANDQWVRTRRIWNQHAYHVTNINEDGSVPAMEQSNWSVPGLNNFRQNVQPEGELSAPDLVVRVFPRCVGDYGLVARVRNLGQAAVPAGVVVGFYEGDPQMGGVLLGQEVTTKDLYPAEAEDVILDLPNPSEAITEGLVDIYVIADDGMPDHPWHECRTDNNSDHATGKCAMPG